MGWSNYIYNKAKKVAIEVGKFEYNELDEQMLVNLEEYIMYNNEVEVPNQAVLIYLWDKCFIHNAVYSTLNMFMHLYGGEEEWGNNK